jgi:mono/diheme cytochrome c family protein
MTTSHDAALARGFAGIGAAMAVAVLAACSGGQDAVVEAPPQAAQVAQASLIQDGYVGSGACAECHGDESATWEASHHNGIFRPGAEPTWKNNPPPAYESAELAVATTNRQNTTQQLCLFR